MSVDAFVNPKSIAIVGASGREGNRFARPLGYLLRYGYEGAIYPVNPKYSELRSLRCYPDLYALPEVPDLVCILVSAEQSLEVVQDCVRLGIPAAILYSAGFAESGARGAELHERLLEIRAGSDLRLLGPNSAGIVCATSKVTATFSGSIEQAGPIPGPIAFVGQSGAIGGSFMQLAREAGLGVGAWFSTGNEADLTAVEVASSLLRDPTVRIIAIYLESLRDGAAYQALLSDALAMDKRIVVLYAGESDEGQLATQSHTGAMLPPTEAFSLATVAGGGVQVHDFGELLNVAGLLALEKGPLGPKIGVVSSSGGAATLAVDACIRTGMEVGGLGAEASNRLRALLPPYASHANPIDVTASMFAVEGGDSASHKLAEVFQVVAEEPDIDITLVVLTNIVGPTAVHAAEEIVLAHQTSGKPIIVCWLAAHDAIAGAREVLANGGVMMFSTISAAAAALGAIAHHAAGRGQAVAAVPRDVLRPSELAGMTVNSVLDALGIARPRSVAVTSADELAAAVRSIGSPVVLKVLSPDIPHKSDVGGVRLHVSEEKAEESYHSLLEDVRRARPDARIESVLVQQVIESGHEMLVGLTMHDSRFPPVLTIGVGGFMAEVYRDTASTLLPVSRDRVHALVRSLRGAVLLSGYRGAPTGDVEAFVDVVMRIARLQEAVALGTFTEIELNPVVVLPTGRGAMALDILVTRDARMLSIIEPPADGSPSRVAVVST